MRNKLRVALVLGGLFLGIERAEACGWDNETYYAEAKSLPCVLTVLVGSFPEHTPEYYEARIQAADEALKWAPGWLEALDMKGIALMKLGRLEEAKAVFLQRAEIDPEGYPTHANLGTLYTFTGDFEQALFHTDKAMEIEPEAHFGREKYHRALIVYLQEVAKDPTVAEKRNFLDIPISDKQRYQGSKKKFEEAGLSEDVFDALVSMIAVYGAKDVPDIYLAFGDVLALRGHLRLAWTAYQGAVERKHPRKKEILGWQAKLRELIKKDYFKGGSGQIRQARIGGIDIQEDTYRGIEFPYGNERAAAKKLQKEYAKWEKQEIAKGLPVWSDAGLKVIYEKQAKLSSRCTSPGVIREEPASAPASEATTAPAPQEAP